MNNRELVQPLYDFAQEIHNTTGIETYVLASEDEKRFYLNCLYGGWHKDARVVSVMVDSVGMSVLWCGGTWARLPLRSKSLAHYLTSLYQNSKFQELCITTPQLHALKEAKEKIKNVVALGVDCVVCRANEDAANNDFTAGDSALTVLVMILSGAEPEQVRRDLCFSHRTHLERVLRLQTKESC